jgi:hypothetical protein
MSAHAASTFEERSATPVAIEPAPRRATPRPNHEHRIEVNLRDVSQLFNSMDPSPFHDKNLDHDAEEFIVSWAQAHPIDEPVALVLHLQQMPDGIDVKAMVERAVHNYFSYRARMNRLELSRLMKEGRHSLLVGLPFLTTCLTLAELCLVFAAGTSQHILKESLTIAGWVAMWKPLETYLYEWWPVRRRGKVFTKLSHMRVEVRHRAP